MTALNEHGNRQELHKTTRAILRRQRGTFELLEPKNICLVPDEEELKLPETRIRRKSFLALLKLGYQFVT